MDRGTTELITYKVKPGILSSTFRFPEMMLNLITSSPIYTRAGTPPTPRSGLSAALSGRPCGPWT